MTPSEVAAARRHRARKGEGDQLRDEILAKAADLLLATGSADAVSIRAVADAVGVTPPSIYRHFADKSELIYSVCLASYEGLAEDIAAAIVDGDPYETLLGQARAYVHYGVAHPEHYRLMFMTREDKAPADLLEHLLAPGSAFALVQETTEAVIAAGLVRADLAVLGATIVGIHLWSAVHGITALQITTPGLPWGPIDEVVEHHLEILLSGLGTPKT